jgi:glycosyltransferase involved in cell wall biosynthesis
VKFSIVSASFNQGRFIRDCIESVLAQKGIEFEHIIFDAGSTDETLSILKEYPHLKWVSEPDKGMSDAINKGFLKATGDWVMWLNTDDYLLPGALEHVARFAEQNPDADVIYGGWNFVSEEKQFIKKMKLFPFDLMMMIHYGPYIGSTACFFRRKTVIDEKHLLDIKFRVSMDGEYYSRLGRAGKKFAYLPEILAEFRVHGQNTSTNHATISGMNGIFKYQAQLAEGASIRRAYGITLFNHPIADPVADAVLWFYYRFKKILLKVLNQSY